MYRLSFSYRHKAKDYPWPILLLNCRAQEEKHQQRTLFVQTTAGLCCGGGYRPSNYGGDETLLFSRYATRATTTQYYTACIKTRTICRSMGIAHNKKVLPNNEWHLHLVNGLSSLLLHHKTARRPRWLKVIGRFRAFRCTYLHTNVHNMLAGPKCIHPYVHTYSCNYCSPCDAQKKFFFLRFPGVACRSSYPQKQRQQQPVPGSPFPHLVALSVVLYSKCSLFLNRDLQ